ncbi:MAG: hypothetical protein O9284_18155 [Steroidobacteraceae bacterium]|jgi:hypothetical protein|nr:hypothetical protein [Steroidobacteraceae bacterium]
MIRLVGGILLGAALILALLWWRAHEGAPPEVGRIERVDSPTPASGDGSAPVATPPSPGAPAGATGGGDAETFAPLPAAARSELLDAFGEVRLPPGVLERLVAGRVGEAIATLRETPGDDTALALERVGALCLGFRARRPQMSTAEIANAGLGDLPGPTRARLEAAVREQGEWAAAFAADCERSGAYAPPFRDEVQRRIRECAEAGGGDCLFRTLQAQFPSGSAERLSRLQSAAVLGSRDAMLLLVHEIESRERTPQSLEAARYWREQLAKVDPEYRVARLSCDGADCEGRAVDPDDAMRVLLGAVREGSTGALATLAMSPSRVAAAASVRPAFGLEQIAQLNRSETDAYAWSVVAEKLAAAGCLGLWPNWAAFVGAPAQLERSLSPAQIPEARRAAEGRWDAYGGAIAASRGCTLPTD